MKKFDLGLEVELELDTITTSLGGMDFELDLDGFDLGIDGIEAEEEKPKNRYVLPKLHRSIMTQAVHHKHAQSLIEDIGDAILAGETVHALLSGNFIFGDIFEALAVQKNVKFDDITISTLSISQENVDSLHNLIEGDYIGSLNLIISSFYWAHNRQNAPYIYEALDIADKFQLAVASTHTKITLIKIGDQKIVARGSANLRSSASIEEVSFETNPELYDFHMEWHQDLLKDYATIKKPISGARLHKTVIKGTEGKKKWQQVAKDGNHGTPKPR